MGVNRVYLTEAGARIAMYCQHNDMAIEFTQFGVGDGENLKPKEATAMTNEVVRFSVNGVKEIEARHYRISGEMASTALTSDLNYRELGLYVIDPETRDTVLYCYGNAKGADFDYTEVIPAFDTSSTYSSRKFDVELFLENDHGAKLTITEPSPDEAIIMYLQEEVEGVKRDIDNIRQLLGEEGFEIEDNYTVLNNLIAEERMVRAESDTNLGRRIDEEATARVEADTALGQRIDGEATARANADNALGGRIDTERVRVFNCTTSKYTASKEISCPAVYEGLVITVRFENGNDIASPTIKIGGVDYAIKLGGANNYGLTSYYGSSTEGAYVWDAGTELTLYYIGSIGEFRVLGNPLVSCKRAVYAGTEATKPEYKRYIDGWKVIHGAVSVGSLASNSEFKATCLFPFNMSSAGYQCTVLPRFGSSADLHKGAELAYYPQEGKINLFMYNNSGTAMNSPYIDWCVSGY